MTYATLVLVTCAGPEEDDEREEGNREVEEDEEEGMEVVDAGGARDGL